MMKSAIFAAVMALAFTATPALAQPAVVADEPVVVVADPPVLTEVEDEPVVVATDPEIVVEPKTWLDWVQEGAFALLGLFGAGAVAALMALIFKMLPGVGKAIDDDMRARIRDLLLNGLYSAVGKLGRGVDPRTAKLSAVDYATAHGGSYFKRLGVDPASPDIRDALVAQTDRMLSDPAVPTPPSLTPQEGKPAVAAVAATPSTSAPSTT